MFLDDCVQAVNTVTMKIRHVVNTCMTELFHYEGNAYSHKISSTSPFYIEVPLPSHEIGRIYTYVLGVAISSLFL